MSHRVLAAVSLCLLIAATLAAPQAAQSLRPAETTNAQPYTAVVKEARAALSRSDWETVLDLAGTAEQLADGEAVRVAAAIDLAIEVHQRRREREQVLELMLRKLDVQRDGDLGPLTLARTMHALATTERLLGRDDRAEELLREALVLRLDAEDDAPHPRVATLQSALAGAIERQRPDDLETVQLLEERARLDGSPYSWQAVARWYAARDRLDEAIPLMERVIAQETARAEPRGSLADFHRNLATWAEQAGDGLTAETALEGAVEARRDQIGTRHPLVAYDLKRHGAFLVRQERWSDALVPLEEAEALNIAAWGDNRSGGCACDVTALLATAYAGVGDEERATTFRREPVDTDIEPDPRTADREARLETIGQLRAKHREVEAAQQAAELVELQRRADDEPVGARLEGLRTLATLQDQLGRYDELETTLEEARTQLGRLDDDEALAVGAWIESRLSRAAERRGDLEGAALHLQRAATLRLTVGHPMQAARHLSLLASLEARLDRQGDAAETALAAAAHWERLAGIDARERRSARLVAVSHLRQDGRHEEAEAILLDLLEIEQLRDRPRPTVLRSILRPLQWATRQLGRLEEAAAIGARVEALDASHPR